VTKQGDLGSHGGSPWWFLLALSMRSTLASRGRLLASVGVSAAGVSLLLMAIAMQDVAQAREDRKALRTPVVHAAAEAAPRGFLYRDVGSFYGGEPVSAHEVAASDSTDLIPAGLTRLPKPGELAVSPRLQALMEDPSTTLADRYPGLVTETVSPAGLVGPDELVVWSGVSATTFDEDAVAATTFLRPGSDGTELPPELLPAQLLLIVGFLVPLIGLLMVSATVGGAQRDARLAALRIVGLSSRQASLAAAFEALVLGLMGVVAGVVAFAGLRQPLAPLAPVAGGVWPQDVELGAAWIATITVVIPCLGALGAVAALRSVHSDPLGVTRRAAFPRPSAWRLAPLALGTSLLTAAVIQLGPLSEVSARGVALVVAVGLCTLGLLTGGALLAHAAGAAVRHVTFAPLPLTVAAARVRSRAGRISRTTNGLAALVFVSGVLLSFFPLLGDAAAGSLKQASAAVGDTTYMVSIEGGKPADLQLVSREPTVSGAATLWHVPVTSADGPDGGMLNVVDCAGLVDVLPETRHTCTGALLSPTDETDHEHHTRTLQPYEFTDRVDGTQALVPVGKPVVASSDTTIHAPSLRHVFEAAGMPADMTIATERAGRSFHDFQATLLVRHDGTASERVRTALTSATDGAQVLSLAERHAIANNTTRSFRGLTLTAFASGAIVALMSLLISIVAYVREQRVATTALWVCGLPTKTMRHALILQLLLACAPTLAIAAALSGLAAQVFLSLSELPTAVPWPFLVAVSTAALAIPGVAALAMSALVKPDLRFENIAA
jgi:hypothetical protein